MSQVRQTRSSAWLLGVLLAGAFALLYAALAPAVTRQGWDSLSYAYAAEAPEPSGSWGNHPLGHSVFDLALWTARQFGYTQRALPLFVVIGSIFGGLAVGGFFLLCDVLVATDRRVALALALTLGGSYAAWHYAGSADIYSFSLLLCAAAWAAIISHVRFQLRAGVAGALVGLATLAHQLNGMLVLPGAFLILTTAGHGSAARRLFKFLGTAAFVGVLGYALLGYLATSSTSPSGLLAWAKGYWGDSTYGRHLHLAELRVAAAAAAGAVVHRPAVPGTRVVSNGFVVLLLLLTVRSVVLSKRLAPPLQWLMGAALLHCVVDVSLIWWWEPDNGKFWVLAFIPWLLILACASCASSGRTVSLGDRIFLRGCLPVLAVGILLYNFLSGILPQAIPDLAMRNALSAWTRHSNPRDVLIPSSELFPHLRYWEDRPDTVLLYRIVQAGPRDDRFKKLRTTIDAALGRNADVLYAPAAAENVHDDELAVLQVTREALRTALAGYDQQEAFSYVEVYTGKRLPVYRLSAPHAAAAR